MTVHEPGDDRSPDSSPLHLGTRKKQGYQGIILPSFLLIRGKCKNFIGISFLLIILSYSNIRMTFTLSMIFNKIWLSENPSRQ